MKRGDEGYTLVSLLALIAVMGIAMATIAPTWRFLVIRDREEELIFRGEQYRTAIELYQKEFNALPTKLADLVKHHKIRRLFRDPTNGREFELIYATPEGNMRASRLSEDQQRRLRSADMPGGTSMTIVGVVSSSPEKALRPWNDKEYYNEWEFIAGEGQQDKQGETPGGDDDDADDEGDEDG